MSRGLEGGLGIDYRKSLFRPKKDHPIQEPDWHHARPRVSLSRRAVHRAISVSFESFAWYTNKQSVVVVVVVVYFFCLRMRISRLGLFCCGLAPDGGYI